MAKAATIEAPRRAGREKAPAPSQPARSPWILGWWQDLLLFVATPLLLLPLFSLIQIRWSAQDIYLFVGAFGAMGHHLPGMIRAYGDSALFDRFRIRFLVAPIVLLAVCIFCSVYGLKAIEVVAFTWGIWHGMMQTYGFCRIYDAKGAPGAAGRARTDLLLCFAWFGGAVVLSPLRMRSFLDLFYEGGGPAISSAALDAVRAAAFAAIVLVTLVFAWQHYRDWRAGRGVSAVKLWLLATSLAFWWYCNNGVTNILVGIALFEVFHDVQYLSIVWMYNRNRVERDPGIRGFLRFVFRRSGALIGLYVGLVFAYGALGLIAGGVPAEGVRQALLGLVTASALLHFYYDGFIWKVRESSTASSLGIAGSGEPAPARLLAVPWIRHATRWAVLLIPFTLLCLAQARGWSLPVLERRERVAQTFPTDAIAQLNLGKAFHEVGRLAEAGPAYEAAASLNPNLKDLDYYRGLLAGDLGDIATAEARYRSELARNPKSSDSETNLAGILLARGKPREARERYERSLAIKPDQILARKQLADLLCDEGEYARAIELYEAALKKQPDFSQAADGLARARALAKAR